MTELILTSAATFANPYTDADVWVVFHHEDGLELRRPAFYDGNNLWRVRFAAPEPGRWHWQSFSAPYDVGLATASGELTVAHDETTTFLSIPAGKRNLVRRDGTPVLMVADTPWALPWRATVEEAELYARDRQAKGFNTALLMSLQPDRDAVGPRERGVRDGFDVAFDDLPQGRLRQINPAYFQYVDRLAQVLVEHELTPVWQPVFHGYGWRGGRVAGPVIAPDEYARYCRYLVARYGAWPAMWLVGGDGDGLALGIDPAGWEIERWDAYRHPTGIHYAPHALPNAYQDRPWLDFQWCQTGHNGEHAPQRVAMMWEQRPLKAVANGETTYEEIGEPGRAAGWWQGHEAWLNLTAGGTMGIVYGAGSLWQWRADREEQDASWCMAAEADWRTALNFEGSRYVGVVSKIFAGLPFTEMQPDFCHTYGRAGLFVPDRLLIVYLPTGGTLSLARSNDVPPWLHILDPKTGALLATTEDHAPINTGSGPRLAIFTESPYEGPPVQLP